MHEGVPTRSIAEGIGGLSIARAPKPPRTPVQLKTSKHSKQVKEAQGSNYSAIVL